MEPVPQQNQKQQQLNTQENQLKYLNEQEYEQILQQINSQNIDSSTETSIPIHIIGTLKQQCRYFPSKKGDGNDIAFAQLIVETKDKKNEKELQIIIQKSRITNNQIIHQNFKDICQMLRQTAVIQFQGNLGLAKYQTPCIYAHNFQILKIQAQPIIALKWLQLYQHQLIDQQTTCLAMQICLQELIQLQQLGQQYMEKEIGSTDFGPNSKSENKFKMRIVEICRALQNKPMNKVSIRPPKYPKILYQNIEYYEKKYSSHYNAPYILTTTTTNTQQQQEEIQKNNNYENVDDQEEEEQQQISEQQLKLQIQEQQKLLQKNLPQNIQQERIEYFNSKKTPQVQWFILQLKALEKHAKNQKFTHFVDIGGGRGDLALTIAQFFPHAQVTVIDINLPSLQAGQDFADQHNIKNIQFIHKGVEDLIQNEQNPFDIVVGLHACGGLSDAILNFSVQNSLNFFVCTCCFSSNFNLIPETYLKTLDKYYKKQEDRFCLCRFSESNEGYKMAERCMKMVNTLRLNTVRDIHIQNTNTNKKSIYNLQMLRFAKEYSPKNFVLQGYIEQNTDSQSN